MDTTQYNLEGEQRSGWSPMHRFAPITWGKLLGGVHLSKAFRSCVKTALLLSGDTCSCPPSRSRQTCDSNREENHMMLVLQINRSLTLMPSPHLGLDGRLDTRIFTSTRLAVVLADKDFFLVNPSRDLEPDINKDGSTYGQYMTQPLP